MTRPRDVLDFWFGPDDSAPDARADLWWGQVDDQEAVDREVERRFGDAVETALEGGLCDWRDEPEPCLAYVLLLDQFPRHIYRGTPRAFAGADFTVPTVRRAVENDMDRRLDVPGRVFFYMPLMHAEDREVQRQSVQLYEQLVEDAPDETRSMAENTLEHAREHAEIVERFGRYPHRNPILDRPSSDQERAFLEQMESAYGQTPR